MQKLDSVYEPLNCASVERGKNFQFRLIDGYITGFGLHPLQGYLFLQTFTNIIYVIHALHFAERKNSTKNLKLKWKVVYGSHHYTLQSTSFANTSVLHISVLHSSFLVSNCIRVSWVENIKCWNFHFFFLCMHCDLIRLPVHLLSIEYTRGHLLRTLNRPYWHNEIILIAQTSAE